MENIVFYKGEVVNMDTGDVLSDNSINVKNVVDTEWYFKMSRIDQGNYMQILVDKERDKLKTGKSDVYKENNGDNGVRKFSLFFSFSKDQLKEMDTAIEFKLLFVLLQNAEYNTGMVHLHKDLKAKILNELNITDGYLYVVIRKLKKALVLRGSREIIFINPFNAWYGDIKMRNSNAEWWSLQTLPVQDKPFED